MPPPWRVLVAFALRPAERERLKSTSPPFDVVEWPHASHMLRADLRSALPSGFDAIVLTTNMPFESAELALAGPRLRLVASASAGMEHVDIVACARSGVVVTNTAERITASTADFAVGLMLAAARRFKEAAAAVENGTWGPWALQGMCGVDVHGAVVGIIGLGSIGSAVARRLRAFDCSIIYAGRSRKTIQEKLLGAEFVSLDELYRRADIVLSMCSLTPETRGLVDIAAFRKMKPTAVFVNMARGDVVVQDDLVSALQSRTIFAAGLDVTSPEPLPKNHPLVLSPHCYITPHIGASTEATLSACVMQCIENVLAAYAGLPLQSEVRSQDTNGTQEGGN